MRKRLSSTHVLWLLVVGLLPFASDAVAANKASCFNAGGSLAMATQNPTGGDEEFFTLPSGPSNVMILLDTSGSMMDLPQCTGSFGTAFGTAGTLCEWPTAKWSATTHGTCNLSGELNVSPWAVDDPTDPTPPPGKRQVAWLDIPQLTGKRTNTPYDPGLSTGLVNDNPAWGQTACTANSNSCLFRGGSYYNYGSANWKVDSATPTATPCQFAKNAVECLGCLDGKGYYLFQKYQSGAFVANTYLAVFKGDFLNANPPKYIAARKAVKKLVAIDPNKPGKLDVIRFGLTRLGPGTTGGRQNGFRADDGDGGDLIVPLGPDCSTSFPSTPAGMAPARQAIIDAVNNKAMIAFSGNTPLAETLFELGQYFADPITLPGSPYNKFGTQWQRNWFTNKNVSNVKFSFEEQAPGWINASWAQPGKNQHSLCWPCQQSAVVIVTDGAPKEDGNLPANPKPAAHTTAFTMANGSDWDFTNWTDPNVACAACGNDENGGYPNTLHEVAAFLHTTELRPVSWNQGTQKRTVSVYPISFGLDSRATAAAADKKAYEVLLKTARLGNAAGLFANASSGDELEAALSKAVADVQSREGSFSVAPANSVETPGVSTSASFLPRFLPNGTAFWHGHLHQIQVFDEFANGCNPDLPTNQQPLVTVPGCASPKNANLNGDEVSGKAVCSGTWMLDMACDPITEDAQGNLVKGTFSGGTVVATAVRAVGWDAGQLLSSGAGTTPVTRRKIYTLVDINGDGKITPADVGDDAATGLVPFDDAPAHIALLQTYLALDQQTCATLLNLAGYCGGSTGKICPTPGASWPNPDTWTPQCAEMVINYARGYDVMDRDRDSCAGPQNSPAAGPCPGVGEARTQDNDKNFKVGDPTSSTQGFWMLGDIFHSSPAVLTGPVTKGECDTGYNSQCIPTLYGSKGVLRQDVQTPLAPSASPDAYDLYQNTAATRKRVVLVGSNDGMLHAFDAGDPTVDSKTGRTTYSGGTGAELWAFIPPDLLPKLKDMITTHQYMVDGNIMVRDIWYDANGDRKKEQGEFKTVAVFSERAGGTNFTALDVTDPLKPRFLWTFPQPGSAEARLMGQSWIDFAPKPPPIGPVKIKNGSDPRGFEERWIVMLNGGYDPALARGRAVWMVDAWTGAVLWQFSNAEFASISSEGNMFPVAAGVGLVDIGNSSNRILDFDGFFDTATWGDLGGQLWVARFQEPGDASSGRVGNWFAARAFEERRQPGGAQLAAGRNEFFYMTSNTIDPITGNLHTYLGSGNREHLLADPGQSQICGPDNLIACCQAGCALVDGATTQSDGSCSTAREFKCASGTLTWTAPSADSGTCGGTCTGQSLTTTLKFQCGGAAVPIVVTGAITCDASGACSQLQAVGNGGVFNTPAVTDSTLNNKFYGVWGYGNLSGKAGKTFKTNPANPAALEDANGAKAFDANRFTDVAFSGCAAATASGTCSLLDTTFTTTSWNGYAESSSCASAPCTATSSDNGWFLTYGRACKAAGGCATLPPWFDEKTSAGSAMPPLSEQVLWNSFRPKGSTASANSDPCAGTTSGTQVATSFVVNYLTGAPSFHANASSSGSTLYAASARNTSTPPAAPALKVRVNKLGQVKYTTAQMDAGSGVGSAGGGTGDQSSLLVPEPVPAAYWLELPRQAHQCRHVNPTVCK